MHGYEIITCSSRPTGENEIPQNEEIEGTEITTLMTMRHRTLFLYNVCQCTLCGKCWDRQLVHKKKRLAPGKVPHEKTDLLLAGCIDKLLSTTHNDRIIPLPLQGTDQDVEDGQPSILTVYGRYSDDVHSGYGKPSKQQNIFENCPSFPFVGQTGAGNSTITSVLGTLGQDLPTSEAIHLYVDPFTIQSRHCILYADCEGLDADEGEPLTTTPRKKR
ncbi:uncharacterized protein BDR25DRAFT_353342 [Lindgomyces ingoldianus]|uniref:Uncharacterized protein n=1 Tax=Lindgomyces ingoldianus TaxID=673940 RepID=A0ACB6R1C2_9PLEO|nr:uncharacterized protein BDR25DRAFT_353342 [Lindgomyces ingoldianus]KAF2472317.1 hypothetical protein BDR25DRAFT_353342 [Lindgomyces ingoldianus]